MSRTQNSLSYPSWAANQSASCSSRSMVAHKLFSFIAFFHLCTDYVEPLMLHSAIDYDTDGTPYTGFDRVRHPPSRTGHRLPRPSMRGNAPSYMPGAFPCLACCALLVWIKCNQSPKICNISSKLLPSFCSSKTTWACVVQLPLCGARCHNTSVPVRFL